MTGRVRRCVMWLLATAVVISAGCRPQSGDDADHAPEPVVPVHVAELDRRSFEETIEAPGNWRTTGEVAVVAPFAAVIEKLLPLAGDRVSQGQVLGSLIARESAAALRGA